MGRIGINGGTVGNFANSYSANDLFRYTGAGAIASGDTGGGVFLSDDGGASSLAGFNNHNLLGGDSADYDGTVATDPYNSSTGPGQAHAITQADIDNLDIIGYDLNTPQQPPRPLPSRLRCCCWGKERRYLVSFGATSASAARH